MGRSKMPPKTELCESLETHPALREYFGYCFYKAALRLKYAIGEVIVEHGLLAPQQLGVLVILRSSEPTNQVTLGDALGIDKATMVKLIDGLEKLKCVERVAGKKDRRNKLINITPKGRQLSLEVQKKVREVEADFLSRLSQAEQRTLKATVPKLIYKA